MTEYSMKNASAPMSYLLYRVAILLMAFAIIGAVVQGAVGNGPFKALKEPIATATSWVTDSLGMN